MHTAIRPRAALIVTAVLLPGLLAACGSSTLISPDQSSVAFSITELTVGTGDEAVPGKTASVNYSLWLYNGWNAKALGDRPPDLGYWMGYRITKS